MRLALVCPYDIGAPGGVQQVCLELARTLRLGGDDVRLLAPGEHPEAVSLGSVRSISANRSRVPLSFDRAGAHLMRELTADTDLVHVHEPFIPRMGPAALRLPRPRVATFHADPAPWTLLLYATGGPIGKRLLRGAAVTAVSPVAAAALPATWEGVTIVPNGLDVASYAREVVRKEHRVTFLGRDDPRKGLDVLMAAWPRVFAAVPDAELVVMSARREPREGVVFAGRVDEPEKRRLLASSAVHVCPNLGGESFGMVVAEGMAAGCAVVASEIPAFVDVLGDDGLLVPPDDPQSLTEAIVALLTDRRRRGDLGSRARDAAARFDWPLVAAAYREVYESALAAPGGTIPPRKE